MRVLAKEKKKKKKKEVGNKTTKIDVKVSGEKRVCM